MHVWAKWERLNYCTVFLSQRDSCLRSRSRLQGMSSDVCTNVMLPWQSNCLDCLNVLSQKDLCGHGTCSTSWLDWGTVFFFFFGFLHQFWNCKSIIIIIKDSDYQHHTGQPIHLFDSWNETFYKLETEQTAMLCIAYWLSSINLLQKSFHLSHIEKIYDFT